MQVTAAGGRRRITLNNFGQFAPELLTTSYAKEIWHLYEQSHLTPDVTLTGHFKGQHQTVDLDAILSEIHGAEVEATRRKLALEGIGSPKHSADIE